MKTVVVVDTHWTGHIPTYHRALVERLLELGCRVVSLSPKPMHVRREVIRRGQKQRFAERSYFGEILHFEPRAKIELGFPWSRLSRERNQTPFSRAVGWWSRARHTIDGIAAETGWTPDLVIFPGIETNIVSKILSGDLVDKIFPYKWIGLYLTPKYLRKPFLKFMYKRIFRKDRFFQARYCAAVAVLDEAVVPRLKKVLGNKKILVMPDFTSTETWPEKELEEHRERSALENYFRAAAGSRKIIGLLGELSKRKGITTLIETARAAAARGLPWVFVFAGPLNHVNNDPASLRDLMEKITDAPPNCFFYLDRIPDERDFNGLFKMSDVIFAAYEKFYHSSNMLTKAAYFKKPILVSRGFCMDERVQTFRLGVSIPEGDSAACLRALAALLDGRNLAGRVLNPLFDRYLTRHSQERLDRFLRMTMNL